MPYQIQPSQLPEASICKNYMSITDYQDTYAVRLSDATISVQDIYLNVFAHSPSWVNRLLKIRHRIVGLFGLKTSAGGDNMQAGNLKIGTKTGLFKIYAITANEIIAGEDDRHLDFRVSVLKHNNKVFISTLVKYNNWLGRVYFLVVRPFHKVVVKAMLKNGVKNNRI